MYFTGNLNIFLLYKTIHYIFSLYTPFLSSLLTPSMFRSQQYDPSQAYIPYQRDQGDLYLL